MTGALRELASLLLAEPKPNRAVFKDGNFNAACSRGSNEKQESACYTVGRYHDGASGLYVGNM